MTRPEQRDHILHSLTSAITDAQSLLEGITTAVENQEPYFSHTERFQTLEQTQAQLEDALESMESARDSLLGCEFPALMPRRSGTVVK